MRYSRGSLPGTTPSSVLGLIWSTQTPSSRRNCVLLYLDDSLTMTDDRETEINFAPAFSRHYVFPLEWRPFIFERQVREHLALSLSQQASSDVIIRCLGWSDRPPKDFISPCRQSKQVKSKGRTMTYTYGAGRHSYS